MLSVTFKFSYTVNRNIQVPGNKYNIIIPLFTHIPENVWGQIHVPHTDKINLTKNCIYTESNIIPNMV